MRSRHREPREQPPPGPPGSGAAVWVVEGRVWLDAEVLAREVGEEARALAARAGGLDSSPYDQARAEAMARMADQLAVAVASARMAPTRGRHRR